MGSLPPLPTPHDENEALIMRRLLGFWRDRDLRFAQTEVEKFVKENPDNALSDYFLAILGDMAQQEGIFEEALQTYSRIQCTELKEHIQLKRWEALYHMGRYAELYQETAPMMAEMSESEEFRFYFAEGAFREALALARYEQGKEEAHFLCKEALPVYLTLTESPSFGSYAKLAMAEIFRFMEDEPKSLAIYHQLASHESNPDVLFQVAAILCQYDRQEALPVYEKIAKAGQSKAADAAYQWLLLLADGEEWKTIEEEREVFTTHLENERRAVAYFYLGMISYEKSLFAETIHDLQKSVAQLPPQHDRQALFVLLDSAGQLQNWEQMELFYEGLTSHYPETYAEATFFLASAYLRGAERERASRLFHQVTSDFPHTAWAEKATLQLGTLLIEEKKFQQAHELIVEAFQSNPQSEIKLSMLQLAIASSLAQLPEREIYAQLAVDLERAISSHLFSQAEQQEKELLLAKTYLHLDRTHAALAIVERQKEPDPLLLCYCYANEGTSPEKVIELGEHALKNHPEEASLHLHLFNAYLEVAKEHETHDYREQAAQHLEAALPIYPVSLENRLWLIHYYAREKRHLAIPLLEELLQEASSLQKFPQESYLLATLYAEKRMFAKAESLLTQLIERQQTGMPEASLKLAEVHLLQGKRESAREFYKKLEESTQLGVAYEARLRLARLDFSKRPEESLKKLLELAQRKTLSHEPTHLEAALDYADLKASTYPAKEHSEKLLQLLLGIKEEFTHQNDIWSKDYHACRASYPEKELLYQAYMRYLDARIYMVQARLSRDPSEKKSRSNAARALLSSLRQGKFAVTEYLKEKATLVNE